MKSNGLPKTVAGVEKIAKHDNNVLKADDRYAVRQHLKATEHDSNARQWLMANIHLWK